MPVDFADQSMPNPSLSPCRSVAQKTPKGGSPGNKDPGISNFDPRIQATHSVEVIGVGGFFCEFPKVLCMRQFRLTTAKILGLEDELPFEMMPGRCNVSFRQLQ